MIALVACHGRDTDRAPATPPTKPSTSAWVASAAAATEPQRGETTPRLSVPEVVDQLNDAFTNAAKAIRPSVVRIDVEINRGESGVATDESPGADLPDFIQRFFHFGRGGAAPSPGPVRGTGSGIILDTRGDVITNSHVVEHADKVTVTLIDGRKMPAKVVGRDHLTDVAVVRLEGKVDGLTQARLGDSDKLRVAQWVLAVGSPLGLDQSVTVGIVSGIGTRASRLHVSERARGYIQTDAAINPGNSGGPLVNLAAEVVGMNTMINVGPGGAYGYAIPINQVAQVSQVLLKDGRVRYPYLGVNIGSVDELSADERKQLGQLPSEGAVVTGVVPGGPAAQAGIRAGDVIVKLGGRAVKGAADVVDFVSSQTIGAKVSVEYVRDGQHHQADATLREMPGEEGAAGEELGIQLQTLTEPLARSLGLSSTTKGAVIAEVRPDSRAARAGLQPGDVVVEVDRKPVDSAEAAVAALHAGAKKSHLLRVVGPNGSRFVNL